MAYTSEYDARTDLYVLASDGQPVQVTADQAAAGGSFTWTPDGQTLIFTSAGDGSLWSTPRSGGRPRRISRGDGRHHTPRVSPDGTLLSYLADRGEEVDVVVAAIDGTWQRILNRGADLPLDPSWAPDGTRVIWHAYPARSMPWDESAVVCADIRGGEPRVLAAGPRVAYAQARFAPDGKRIVCVSDRGGALNVTEVGADGAEPRVLNEDAWEHGEPAYSPDGHWIVYTRNVDGDYSLWVAPSGGGQAKMLVDGPGHATAPSWSPDGRSIVYLFDSPADPPDVWRVELDSGRRTRLTFSTMGGVCSSDLVMPEHVSWSSLDGFEVRGHLYAPRDIRPGQHGCLVCIHGGPMNQTRAIWAPLIQYLVQRGWVVVAPNYRGSLGYGRAYREALYGEWGQGDLADNVGGIDLCLERGLIHPRRAVAWGGSAGGYATLVCLTQAPERFAGGVALFGLYDLYSFGLETHRLERYYTETILGPSADNYALWSARSPINYVNRVRVPLLVLQGAADRVVWPAQSDTLLRELDRNRIDYEYVCYPGEGHGFRQVEHVADYALRMDRYLSQKVLRAPQTSTLGVLAYAPMPPPG